MNEKNMKKDIIVMYKNSISIRHDSNVNYDTNRKIESASFLPLSLIHFFSLSQALTYSFTHLISSFLPSYLIFSLSPSLPPTPSSSLPPLTHTLPSPCSVGKA